MRKAQLNADQLVKDVVDMLPLYVRGLSELGFDPPYLVQISLVRLGNARLPNEPDGMPVAASPVVSFDPVMVEAPELTGGWKGLLRPVFDQLWNMYGLPACRII